MFKVVSRILPGIILLGILSFLPDQAMAAHSQRKKNELYKVRSWLKPADPSFGALTGTSIFALKTSTSAADMEARGLVDVPIDYDFPQSPRLNIAYRILPVLTQNGQYVHPSSPEAMARPLLMIINGGPGASSEHLRKYDFSYIPFNESPPGKPALDTPLPGPGPNASQVSQVSSQPPPPDRLKVLTQHFRVVLVDQRGTNGRSSSLDLNNSSLDPQLIADYFGPKQVALDHGAVLQAINPQKNPFYMLAQSYGGLVGAMYLVEAVQNPLLPRPKAIALTSAGIQTTQDAFAKQVQRRSSQRRLLLDLKYRYPDIVPLMNTLRARLMQVDPNSTIDDSLATQLGKGMDWETEFIQKVRGLVKMDDDSLRKEIKGDYATIDILNFVLSSAIITPGFTDRTLYSTVKYIVPLAPWMPDELRNYYNGKSEVAWQNRFLDKVDANPPRINTIPTFDQMREAIAQNHVVFTGSQDDPLIPMATSQKLFKTLRGENTRFLSFEKGGHGAAFFSPNVEVLIQKGFSVDLETLPALQTLQKPTSQKPDFLNCKDLF